MPTINIPITDEKIAFFINSADSVVQYSYRTKRVHEVFMEIPRSTASKLEEKLAEMAGARPDNHTVYEITTPQGSRLFLMFTDLEVLFGLRIEDRRW